MNISKYLVPIIVTSVMALNSFAADGAGSSGGAGDHNSISRFAWFTGDKVVRYCIEQSSDFGTDRERARSAVAIAFATWKQYLKDKEIDGYNYYASSIGDGKKLSKFTSLNTQELKACDGSQDLMFRLGGQFTLKSIDQEFPFESAVMTSHDWQMNQSKGFIWLASQKDAPKYIFWKDQSELIGVLMHGLGHTLGNGHAERTIMDRDLSKYLEDASGTIAYDGPNNKWTEYFRSIDFEYELVPLVDAICSQEVVRDSYYPMSLAGVDSSSGLKGIAQVILGREPVGNKIYYKFVNQCSQFVVRDGQGTTTFDVELRRRKLNIEAANEVMFALYGGLSLHGDLHQINDSVSGLLKTPGGRTVQISFRKNMGRSSLDMVLDEKSSKYWGESIMQAPIPKDKYQLPAPEKD